MKKRRYSYTELGMLLGIFVGGGVAVILFTATGKAVYFSLVGVGLALGLGLGAALDGAKRAAQKREQKSDGEHTV